MIHHYTISVLCVSYGNGITDHPMSSFISFSVCSCHNSIHFRCAPACLLVINIIVFVGVESSRIRQGNGSSRSTSQTVHTNNSILLANFKLCCVVGVMLQQQKQEIQSQGKCKYNSFVLLQFNGCAFTTLFFLLLFFISRQSNDTSTQREDLIGSRKWNSPHQVGARDPDNHRLAMARLLQNRWVNGQMKD